jgi:hypothetical protein
MMRKLTTNTTKIDARIAVIELRSLLVADARIAANRRADLIRRACTLVCLDENREAVAAKLGSLVHERFGRSPESLRPSPATEEALKLLAGLQNGTV